MELPYLEYLRSLNANHELDVKVNFVNLDHLPPLYEERKAYIESKCSFHIVQAAKVHYQKYDDDHWITYIKTWLPECNGLFWTSYKNVCTGLALCIIKQDEIYVRLLCSMCRCGGQLLQYIQTSAREQNIPRVRLHSEPKCVGFYRKYGFLTINEDYETNVFGVRYPTMVWGIIHKERESLCQGTFFFGWMFYIQEIWQIVTVIIGGILAFVCM